MSQRLNAGGARADVLRQCFFSLHIGMSPFLIERFTLLHGGIQFGGQRMLNGLQLFCGFNVVVCQKSVLRQIGFKPNGIFQQIAADFGRGMSLCSPSQQVDIPKIKCGKPMMLSTTPQCAFAKIPALHSRSFRSAPLLLRQNTTFNGSIGIIFTQAIQTDELFPVGRLDRRILPPVIAHFIASAAQIFQEGCKVQRPPDDPVDVPTNLRPDGRLFLFCRLPFSATFSLASGLNHRQPIFAAQVIRYLLNLLKIGFHVAPQLPAVHEGYRIDGDMVMQMLPIQMGSNDHLESVSKQTLRELHTDLMGLFRRQFARFEGLDYVIALHTISFVIALLGSFHVQAGVFYTAAIQAALK